MKPLLSFDPRLVPVPPGLFAGLEEQMKIPAAAARERVLRACFRGIGKCGDCRGGPLRRYRRRLSRCGACGTVTDVLAGSLLARLRLPPKQWLVLIELFDMQMTCRSMASFLNVSKMTAHRAGDSIRMSLAARDPRWGAASAFGAFLGDRVRVEPLGGESAADLFAADAPRALHANGFVYAEWRLGYDAIICHRAAVKRRPLVRAPGSRRARDPFLDFLKWQMAGCRGISLRRFPYFLKELEIRYNRKGETISDLILDSLAASAPSETLAA